MEFKAGDLVMMKSGGPLMTVEQVSKTAMTGEDGVWCVWFEKKGNKQTVCRETFLPILLEIAKKPGLGAVSLTRG